MPGSVYIRSGFAPGSIHYCPACDLSLPGVQAIGNPATIRIGWRGAAALASAPDHLIVAQVGSSAVNSGAHCFDNETFSEQTFAVAQSSLIGQGILLESPGLAADATKKESAYLDYIEVDYQRAFTVDSESLTFSWPDSNAEFVVSGLADSTPEIRSERWGAPAASAKMSSTSPVVRVLGSTRWKVAPS